MYRINTEDSYYVSNRKSNLWHVQKSFKAPTLWNIYSHTFYDTTNIHSRNFSMLNKYLPVLFKFQVVTQMPGNPLRKYWICCLCFAIRETILILLEFISYCHLANLNRCTTKQLHLCTVHIAHETYTWYKKTSSGILPVHGEMIMSILLQLFISRFEITG